VDREELGVLSRYPAVSRRLLTVDEYHRMAEAGILTEEDDVELIERELVAMAPIGSEHVATTNAFTRLLVTAVGDRGIAALLDDRSRPLRTFAPSAALWRQHEAMCTGDYPTGVDTVASCCIRSARHSASVRPSELTAHS
jgi:hypothetical protein